MDPHSHEEGSLDNLAAETYSIASGRGSGSDRTGGGSGSWLNAPPLGHGVEYDVHAEERVARQQEIQNRVDDQRLGAAAGILDSFSFSNRLPGGVADSNYQLSYPPSQYASTSSFAPEWDPHQSSGMAAYRNDSISPPSQSSYLPSLMGTPSTSSGGETPAAFATTSYPYSPPQHMYWAESGHPSYPPGTYHPAPPLEAIDSGYGPSEAEPSGYASGEWSRSRTSSSEWQHHSPVSQQQHYDPALPPLPSSSQALYSPYTAGQPRLPVPDFSAGSQYFDPTAVRRDSLVTHTPYPMSSFYPEETGHHNIEARLPKPVPKQPYPSTKPATMSSQPPPPQPAAEARTEAAPEFKRSRTLSKSTPTKPPLVTTLSKQGGKKMTVEVDCACFNCSEPISRLMLRGRPQQFEAPYSPLYSCPACTPLDGSSPKDQPSPENQQAHDELESPPQPTRRPTLANRSGSFRKKSKRPGAVLTSCDVCLRDICTGSVVLDGSGALVDFAVEVICVHCTQMYQRCSDCGGGGGVRLGVGKWRSVQMFEPTRKTCILPHTRLGSLENMVYEIWAVKDIPPAEMNHLTEQMKAIFVNTMLSGMAIPEVLETQSAVAKTFDQVNLMTQNGWRCLEPVVRYDVEPKNGIRRFVATRTSTPNPRKGNRPRAEEPVESDLGGKVIPPGRDLAGFIIAEWDVNHSSLFLLVVVPWASGETFDASTILLQNLVTRVFEEREVEDQRRARLGLPPTPTAMQVWTMMFFKRDTRMMNHLEKKRGFSLLEDYVFKYPDTDLGLFPPRRPVYLPVERQEGWRVLVKRIGPHEQWGGKRETKKTQTTDEGKEQRSPSLRRSVRGDGS